LAGGSSGTARRPVSFWPAVLAERLAGPFLSPTREAIAFHEAACHPVGGDEELRPARVNSITPLRPPQHAHHARSGDDTLWAVVATVGRTDRIAEIYRSRDAALEDRAWRAAQVRAYEHLFARTKDPAPRYSVVPIRRADIPRAWSPLPALGFLRGRFV
jgi:hypothetical protein